MAFRIANQLPFKREDHSEHLETPTRFDILSSLPKYVALRILLQLPPDSIAKSARVCRNWKLLATDHCLWINLIARDFGRTDSALITAERPKETYLTALKILMQSLPKNGSLLALTRDDRPITLQGELTRRLHEYVSSLSSQELLVALCLSVKYGYMPLVDAITQDDKFKAIDVNERDELGLGATLIKIVTPKVQSISKSNSRTAKFSCEFIVDLIDSCRLDVQAVDSNGVTVLQRAGRSGNLPLVKHLINIWHLDVHAIDVKHRTLLHSAAKSGNLELVQYLINTWQLDVTAVDDRGRSVLHFAAKSGNLELVQFLITHHHLNANALDFEGFASLHYAAESGNLELVQFLTNICHLNGYIVTSPSGKTLLHMAAKSGNVALVEYLIKTCHYSVNFVDLSGNTVLHVAAKSGNLLLVQRLIENLGAKRTAINQQNQTILFLATESGILALVQYLIRNYPDDFNLGDIDSLGRTILHLAAETGNLLLVQFLIKDLCNTSSENFL